MDQPCSEHMAKRTCSVKDSISTSLSRKVALGRQLATFHDTLGVKRRNKLSKKLSNYLRVLVEIGLGIIFLVMCLNAPQLLISMHLFYRQRTRRR